MLPVYSISHAILSPLGVTAEQSFGQVMQLFSGIKLHKDSQISPEPFYASRLGADQWMMLQSRYGKASAQLSPFEQMCIYVAEQALQKTTIDVKNDDCLLILATTKGNISWLDEHDDARNTLHYSAKLIADYLGVKHKPIVVSNACISGSLAIINAARFLESGKYKHAIVIGCDSFSQFVFHGFQSFHALADGPCKPFDKNRTGINLGEAAACMILSTSLNSALDTPLARMAGGGVSNDANHLSGPSRTGEELSAAINSAMKQGGIGSDSIGAVSAHGTATAFNDEMEAKALNLSGLSKAPLHSLKSYLGHTLGAAGIIESIIACMAMQQDKVLASLGFEEIGVPVSVNVPKSHQQHTYDYIVKTASGFGGCNAALVWEKYTDR